MRSANDWGSQRRQEAQGPPDPRGSASSGLLLPARAGRSGCRDTRVKVILYALFDRFVLKQIKPTYDEYNRLLVDAGILPSLKSVQVARTSGQPAPPPAPANFPEPGESAESGFSGLRTTASAADPPSCRTRSRSAPSSSIRFSKSCRIESPGQCGRPGVIARHRRPPPGASRSRPGNCCRPSPACRANHASQAVSTAVSEATRFPTVEVDTEFVERVKDAMSCEREQVLKTVDRDKLAPMDSDLIDLIGMLFEYMLNDPVLPNVAKALLSHLHTPYLKVALIDRRLLVDSRHPARRAARPDGRGGQSVGGGGQPGPRHVPRHAADRRPGAPGVHRQRGLFDELVAFFDEKMREQQRRSDTMEQRTQEAARGREKLALAKQKAARRSRPWSAAIPCPQARGGLPLQDLAGSSGVHPAAGRGAGQGQRLEAGGGGDAEQLVALFDPRQSAQHRRARMADAAQAAGRHRHHRPAPGAASAAPTWRPCWPSWIRPRTGSSIPWAQDETPAPREPFGFAARHPGPPDHHRGDERRGPDGARAPDGGALRRMRFGTWFEFTGSPGARRGASSCPG
jgi:hypothetical protein